MFAPMSFVKGEFNRSSQHFNVHLVHGLPSEHHPAGHSVEAMLDRPQLVLSEGREVGTLATVATEQSVVSTL